MWHSSLPSDGNRNTNYSKTKSRPSSSFSSSSSSSSVAVPQTPKRNTMEEVWKDINLATTAHDSTPPQAADTAAASQRNFHNMILQDFLAGTFKSLPAASAAGELPQLTLSPTTLSLRSGPGGPAGPPNFCAASSLFSSSAKKKRLIHEAPSCDRHNKRMMKNRESAARSRARKQAYTNELEQEVAHLAEENARLRKQNEELRLEMAAQIPKKNALHRTSSALF